MTSKGDKVSAPPQGQEKDAEQDALQRQLLLTTAFTEFNQLAGELSQRYQALEQEVLQLRVQLAEQEQQQQRAESDRLAVTEQYEALLDILPLGMVMIDNRGQIRRANPTALALLGEPLEDELWFNVIRRSFAPRKDDGHEISLRSGRRVSVLTNSLPDQAGQIVLLHDLTETRLLQSRLSHHERLTAMGQMVAALAHQVRTPLSAALLYASHLQNPTLAEQQRLQFAGKLRSRLLNIEQQIKDMLIFSRGETQLNDVMTVNQLLRAIEDALDVPLTSHDADCDIRDDSQGAVVQINREVLIGAVLNLVNNALQACPAGVELHLVGERLGEQVAISVIDPGPGISAEHIQKVLQPFYTTKAQGTGLGLAVVQAVAKAHGGRFELSSRPGHTCARIILPCYQGSVASSSIDEQDPRSTVGELK